MRHAGQGPAAGFRETTRRHSRDVMKTSEKRTSERRRAAARRIVNLNLERRARVHT